MCMPQDPLSKLLVKNDPLAKVDGRLKIQENYGDKMDPIAKYDPLAQKFGGSK